MPIEGIEPQDDEIFNKIKENQKIFEKLDYLDFEIFCCKQEMYKASLLVIEIRQMFREIREHKNKHMIKIIENAFYGKQL